MWYENLEPYMYSHGELQDRFRAVLHVMDYYHAVVGKQVPALEEGNDGGRIEPLVLSDWTEGASVSIKDEKPTIQSICRHLACQRQLEAKELQDLIPLLDSNDPDEGGYVRVLLTCVNELRHAREKYFPSALDMS